MHYTEAIGLTYNLNSGRSELQSVESSLTSGLDASRYSSRNLQDLSSLEIIFIWTFRRILITSSHTANIILYGYSVGISQFPSLRRLEYNAAFGSIDLLSTYITKKLFKLLEHSSASKQRRPWVPIPQQGLSGSSIGLQSLHEALAVKLRRLDFHLTMTLQRQVA